MHLQIAMCTPKNEVSLLWNGSTEIWITAFHSVFSMCNSYIVFVL